MGQSNPVDEGSPSYIGWRVVFAMFLVEVAIFGFGLYGQGIYVTELRRLNDWSTALVATGITLCLVLGSLLSVFVSDLLRWMGPRGLVLAGIVALASGLVLLASASSMLQLYAGFIVIALAWVGLGTVTAAAIVGTWFDRKRGLAISLTFTGATCSGIVLVPGLVLLVEFIGFRDALGLAAAATVIVMVPIVAAIVRFPPAPERSAETIQQSSASPSRLQLLKQAGFWSVTAPFALALFVQVAFIVHQISILTPAMGFQLAGGAVSLTTAMALVGRIALGLFIHRVDPRRVAAVSIFSQALALMLVGQSSGTEFLFIACAIFGFSAGNAITFPALIVQREFPPAAFSVVLGLSMGVSGVINACGPAAMGLLRDLTGGYATPILVGVAIDVAAAFAALLRPASPHRASMPSARHPPQSPGR